MKKQLEKLKKFWKLIFGRTGILVFLLLVQAVILFGGFALIDKSAWIVNYTIGLLAVIILIYILNARSNSSFKLMWIILILVVPVVGVAFYIFTRVQPGTAYISHRVNALIEEEKDYLTPHKDTLYDVYAESKQECGFMQYLYKRGKYPVYSNASVKYFPLGEDKFQELLYQLERAEKFIFLEYFIVDKGIMWNRILRILARKAREGVEVLCMMAPVHCPFCREITRNVWNNWVSSAKSLHRCDRFYLRIRITGIIEKSRSSMGGQLSQAA